MALALASCSAPADGVHTLHVISTNDVHGAWFDSTYVDGNIRNNIFAVNHYVDSIRNEVGEENLLLIDGGERSRLKTIPSLKKHLSSTTISQHRKILK